MRKLLLSLLALITLGLQAQETSDSIDNGNQNIIYKVVPKKNFMIKDKIIIVNKSPYHILQVVVAVTLHDGSFHPLGSATYIAPGEVSELASFTNNYLSKLKGRQIAIKAKGAKLLIGENSQNSDLIRNIKPSDITYDFEVKLYESHHDLYIELYNSGGKGVMDF